MNSETPYKQAEIDSAWILWQALLDHLGTLWNRYEEPFTERISQQQEWETEQAYRRGELTDDDIPF